MNSGAVESRKETQSVGNNKRRRQIRQRPRPELVCIALCLATTQQGTSVTPPSNNNSSTPASFRHNNDSNMDHHVNGIHENNNTNSSSIKKKAKRKIPTFLNSTQQHQLPNHSPRGPVDRENSAPAPSSTTAASSTTSVKSSPKNAVNYPHPAPVSLQEKEFMEWCKKVLGIESLLEIKYFPYPDFMKLAKDDMDDDIDDDFCDEGMLTIKQQQQQQVQQQQLPPLSTEELIQVRGLAASRDIEVGEVVLRIPYQALMTVTTIIDQDPVLSRVMGPQARAAYGWVDEDEEASFFELPLLTVALLHHAQLGRASPLYHYLQILQSSPTEHMPVLWSKEKLRQDANESVRKMAREIRRDIVEMYTTIIQVLKKDHPHLFNTPTTNNNKAEDDAFSLSRFQWAFALVNSRHWHLPIPDNSSSRRRPATPPSSQRRHHVVDEATQQVVPPASVPTEAWIRESQEAEALVEKEEEEERLRQEMIESNNNNNKPTTQSFMAPLAELLNFGPPCTRGIYNSNTHSFEIIATCSYLKGQEVTFWYSDDCENVMISNYGFTHPMVPKCPTLDDWKQQVEGLEADLRLASEELQLADKELEQIQRRLQQCHCDEIPMERNGNSGAKKPASATRLRHDPNGVRGVSHSPDERGSNGSGDHRHGGSSAADYDRGHGVRRMWQERKKSDLGL